MSELFFKRYYDSVKDSSWDPVETYGEFVQLPAWQQKECNDIHDFQSIKKQFTDKNHWRDIGRSALFSENLTYFPILKCANTYFGTMFKDHLGWNTVEKYQDIPGSVAFGFVINPLTRYLKGITQWVWQNDLVDHPHLDQILKFAICPDYHCLPYRTIFDTDLDKINWIPLDMFTPEKTNQLCNDLFNKVNYNKKLPIVIEKLNASNTQKLKLFDKVKSLFFQNQNDYSRPWLPVTVQQFYAEDLKFYYDLVDNFDPTWTTIKTF